MNSLMNTVRRVYGSGDEPSPEFRYPIVIAPSALDWVEGHPARIRELVERAARAVESLRCFGDRSRWVDFSASRDSDAAAPSVNLRVEVVKTRNGKVVRITRVPFTAVEKAR
ncbi:MAG: hypothetical protein AAF098_06300 [Pseudomonadota bacterium]